jgi:hypothetical protein
MIKRIREFCITFLYVENLLIFFLYLRRSCSRSFGQKNLHQSFCITFAVISNFTFTMNTVIGLLSLSSVVSLSASYYIPTDSIGTILIPAVIAASGRSIFKIGKIIGASATKNHGIHGGPIHHVFPKEYRVPSASPALPSSSSSYRGSSNNGDHYDDRGYDDYGDDDHERPRPPPLHKNVVDAHYSEGMHYHYSRGH